LSAEYKIVCSGITDAGGGDITVGIVAGALGALKFQDSAGNMNAESVPATLTVKSDNSAPSVAIVATSTKADGTAFNSDTDSNTDGTDPVSGDITFTITITDDYRLQSDVLSWAAVDLSASCDATDFDAGGSGLAGDGLSAEYKIVCSGITTAGGDMLTVGIVAGALGALKFQDSWEHEPGEHSQWSSGLFI
jgi:hypothetical protein